MNYSKFSTNLIFILLAIFMIVVHIRPNMENKSANVTSENVKKLSYKEQESQPKLILLESHRCYDSIFRVPAVCGTIMNNRNRTVFFVNVSVDFLDRNGSIVDRSSDVISMLEPYQRWAFQVNVYEPNVSSYKIKDYWGL